MAWIGIAENGWIGEALNLKSMMGTVIHDAQLERIEHMLAHLPQSSSAITPSTARITQGGYRLTGLSPLDGFDLSGGAFFAPTIIEDISVSDELWREEVFGPVLVVKKFSVRASSPSSLAPADGLREDGRRSYRTSERLAIWTWSRPLDERSFEGTST